VLRLEIVPPQPDGPYSSLSIRGGRFRAKPARVVAVNLAGDTRTLFESFSMEEAVAERSRLEFELDALGSESWCELHKISQRWAVAQ
jgi:hypothetical protein